MLGCPVAEPFLVGHNVATSQDSRVNAMDPMLDTGQQCCYNPAQDNVATAQDNVATAQHNVAPATSMEDRLPPTPKVDDNVAVAHASTVDAMALHTVDNAVNAMDNASLLPSDDDNAHANFMVDNVDDDNAVAPRSCEDNDEDLCG